jgi:pimeloyl-ACP methyl ester carboxylesterase
MNPTPAPDPAEASSAPAEITGEARDKSAGVTAGPHEAAVEPHEVPVEQHEVPAEPLKDPASGASGAPIEFDTEMILIDSRKTPRQHVPLALHGIRAFFGALGAVAPVAAGRLASRMFMKPRRHRTPRRETQWLRNAETREIDVGSHKIATHTWGQGPIVLLLHGWEGRGSQMGAFAAPLVEAGYQAVAVDLPAHGSSSGQSTDAFTCGRVVAELCRKLGSIHGVVAHSFGGTAVLLAMAEGLRVERAVLISPGVAGDTFFTGFAKIIGLPPHGTDELRRVIHERFDREDWRIFTPHHQGTVLGEHSGATMVVHDTCDEEVSYAESVELAHWTRGARLLSTRGVGHRRILREPLVVQNVVAFINNK